jgi:hypothetical protein
MHMQPQAHGRLLRCCAAALSSCSLLQQTASPHRQNPRPRLSRCNELLSLRAQRAAAMSCLSCARFMLVTDLDGTLYDPTDASHAALRRFNALWKKYCAHDCRLVYSTGRSRAKYHQLRVRARVAAAVWS